MSYQNVRNEMKLEPKLGINNTDYKDIDKKNHQLNDVQIILPYQKFGVIIVAFLVIASISLLIVDQVLRPDAFRIEHLRMVGPFKQVEKQKIADLVSPYVGKNYFSIDLTSVRNELDIVDWVETVSVRRKWPKTIIVEYNEHTVAARWNKTQLIDTKGKLFTLVNEEIPDDLVILTGVDEEYLDVFQKYKAWGQILKKSGYVIQELNMDERYSYQVKVNMSDEKINQFNEKKGLVIVDDLPTESLLPMESQKIISSNEIILKLGKDNLDERLQRFIKVADKVLGSKVMYVKAIDFRYGSGFAVSWKEKQEQKITKIFDMRERLQRISEV